MRKLLLALALALPLAAQCPTGLTAVVDTIYNSMATGPAFTTFHGSITITPPPISITSPSNATFSQVPLTVLITTGALSMCLQPNDTASPAGTSYTVRYLSDRLDRTTWSETWFVPTSGSPLKIYQVRVSVVPSVLPYYLTAKGDLLAFSSLPVRFPVGANNTILAADSALSTGFGWKTIAAVLGFTPQAVMGSNVLYRCSVAGTLRVGELTTVAADCGTAIDTGLRIP